MDYRVDRVNHHRHNNNNNIARRTQRSCRSNLFDLTRHLIGCRVWIPIAPPIIHVLSVVCVCWTHNSVRSFVLVCFFRLPRFPSGLDYSLCTAYFSACCSFVFDPFSILPMCQNWAKLRTQCKPDKQKNTPYPVSNREAWICRLKWLSFYSNKCSRVDQNSATTHGQRIYRSQ